MSLLLIIFAVVAILLQGVHADFKIGTGIYDMTGPCVEVNFMGYALPGQRGTGIHMRLRARSYVVLDTDTDKRVVYVSVDGGMGSDIVNKMVIEYLNSKLSPAEQNLYNLDNVAISGTHTHSGPAGFLQYVLYQVTSLGYVKETLATWVSSIGESILQAHNKLTAGTIYVNSGKLYGSNINRSPSSYLLNSEEERNQYEDGNTDKTMLLLKFVADGGKNMGVATWFAVHGTSMNNTNTLTSGDNRGYASYALERDVNGANVETGKGDFVAAFGSSNLGDISPNTAGPKCIDTGLPCDGSHSTCNGRTQMCIAFGPGTNGDMFESTKIIGDKQYQFAKGLMESATSTVSGKVDYVHDFVDMSKLEVTLQDGSKVTLCNPAMGYAFAAGTTDGPGAFNFTQGTTSGNPFWDKVSSVLSKPTQAEIDCQAPKPILLNTGDIDFPHAWDPQILPLQILRIGNVFILSVPCEFTTMAGRRLRNRIKQLIIDSGYITDQEIYVTIAGLTNNYSSYVVTYEEYQAQRYEAASTIFGPHTLEGYIQEFSRLMMNMITGEPIVQGPPPPDFRDRLIQLIPEPVFDFTLPNTTFGDVVEGFDAQPSYHRGEIVRIKFIAGNPRNNLKTQGTYMSVNLQTGTGVGNRPIYSTVAVDGDWETKFSWLGGFDNKLGLAILPFSTATCEWDIPKDAALGTYQICHEGAHKLPPVNGTNVILPYSGCSSSFTVVE